MSRLGAVPCVKVLCVSFEEARISRRQRGADASLIKGFSLVELMVAIAIGSIILLAVSIVFTQISKGAKSADDSSRAIENGNFALRVLKEDLRMVGFVGLSNDPVSVEAATNGYIASGNTNNCGDQDWPFLSGTTPSLQVIPAATSLPCIPSASLDTNSPIIVTRHANGLSIPTNAFAVGGSLAGSTRLYIQTGPTGGGTIFAGKDYASKVKGGGRHAVVCRNEKSATSQVLASADGGCPPLAQRPDAPIFEYNVNVYYVRPCSRPAGATCAATDDGGEPIPTLVRRQLDLGSPASFVETPVAEGVERVWLRFFDANGVVTTDANQAASINIALLMRDRKTSKDLAAIDGNVNDSKYTYYPFLPDTSESYQCSSQPSPACEFRRHLMNDTVALKNSILRN